MTGQGLLTLVIGAPERNTRRRISDSSLIDHRLTMKCAMNCLETLVSSTPFQWNLSNQPRINRET